MTSAIRQRLRELNIEINKKDHSEIKTCKECHCVYEKYLIGHELYYNEKRYIVTKDISSWQIRNNIKHLIACGYVKEIDE